jgi:hypothetical protein
MIDMNMAATKTTLTATFWLMRASTTSLFLASLFVAACAGRHRSSGQGGVSDSPRDRPS